MILVAHISDLHFGPVLANSKAGVVLHQWPHAIALCRGLPSALDDARAFLKLPRDTLIHVVASGDLTVSGSAQDFAVAHAFLRSRSRILRSGIGQFFGLGVADEHLGAVPGNHDHWGGTRTWPRVPAYNPHLFKSHFRRTPWMKTWRSLTDDVDLEVYGIDSNSALATKRYNTTARGSISVNEFEELEKLLLSSPTRARAVMRIIVCHHSLLYPGTRPESKDLDAPSKAKLLSLAGRYGVAAVLTGHTHDMHFGPLPATDPFGRPWPVKEYRSAATLPFGQKTNGFWFYRIDADAGVCTWSAWRYGWNGSRFMRNSATPCDTFTI